MTVSTTPTRTMLMSDPPVRLPELAQIEAAARTVYATLTPTAQIAWPLLAKRAGCEV